MEIREAIIFLALLIPSLGTVKCADFLDDNLESLYSAYKLIEDTVKSDHKMTFKINQAFSPAINFRYWQVDGAEVVPIVVCVTLQEQPSALIPCNSIGVSRNEVLSNCTACWHFRWTNSLLLNLIPGDVMLAMDPTITTILYSDILQSTRTRRLRLDLCLNESTLLQTYSLDDYEQAFALFLNSGKAMTDGADSRHRGYIARWYTYYSSDSYFSKLNIDAKIVTRTLITLWTTFSLLNLLIPILSITRGRQIYRWTTKVTATLNQRVHRASALVLILFNVLWLLSALILGIKGYPNVLGCFLRFHQCRIPSTTTSYNYVLGVFITKVVILPIAFLSELVAAIHVAKGILPYHASHMRMKAKYYVFTTQVLIIWQLFLFVQITVGLISIPLLVLMLVSPAEILLSGGGMVLAFLLLIFILVSIPVPSKLKTRVHLRCCLQSSFLTLETLIIAAFLCSTYWCYLTIVHNGTNMDGTKVYIISLLPSLFITIIIWVIKKKLLTDSGLKKKASEVSTTMMLQDRNRKIDEYFV